MDERLRAAFDRAIALKDAGRLDEAREELLELHRASPESPAILAVLADTIWDSGSPRDAIEFFRLAQELRPSSEILSISVFHCLLESGEAEAALDEMKRYVGQYEAVEYQKLLDEMKRGGTAGAGPATS